MTIFWHSGSGSHGRLDPPRILPSRLETFHALENGDRLTRAEFERRYDAMPDLKKAELIEGEVYGLRPSVTGGTESRTLN